MRKPSPQITPPICENCSTPMIVVNNENIKMWECPNRIECGGHPRLYYERKKQKSNSELFRKVQSRLRIHS